MKNTTTPPALLSPEDFARLLRVDGPTFDALLAAGQIGPAGFPVGPLTRWDAAEVARWLRHRDPKTGGLWPAADWRGVWAFLRVSVEAGHLDHVAATTTVRRVSPRPRD